MYMRDIFKIHENVHYGKIIMDFHFFGVKINLSVNPIVHNSLNYSYLDISVSISSCMLLCIFH